MNLWGAADSQLVCTACPAGGFLPGLVSGAGKPNGWLVAPTYSEVHGLASTAEQFAPFQLSVIRFQF